MEIDGLKFCRKRKKNKMGEASNHESPKRLKVLAFNVTTSGGNNLLHRIVLENSHSDTRVNELYLSAFFRSLSDVPVNCLNEDGFTALHLAVMKNSSYMVEKMLTCVENINVNAKMSNGDTVLIQAVKLRHRGIIRTLLLKGADINKGGCENNRPIHCAIEERDSETVRMLLNHGLDIKSENDYGETPLQLAIESQLWDAFKYLISKGADVNGRDEDGSTPLHCAASLWNPAFVRYLLANGSEVNALNGLGCTALHTAVWGSADELFESTTHTKVAEALISSGANVNVKDWVGETPLHVASKIGKADAIELLLRNGADVNATNKNGRTALHYACEQNSVETVKVLLKNGAQVNTRDLNNETPLHSALFRITSRLLSASREVIELLLNSGADIHVKNYLGKSPLRRAQECGDDAIVEVLTMKQRS